MSGTTPASDIDERSRSFAMTRESIAEATRGWPRTDGTPDGVANLLGEARRLLVGGAITYDNFIAASLKSLHAADLALKLRLGLPVADCRTLGQLITYERDACQVLSPSLRDWYSKPVLHLRNKLSHPSETMALTPGLAAEILESVHFAIAEMFPTRVTSASGER